MGNPTHPSPTFPQYPGGAFTPSTTNGLGTRFVNPSNTAAYITVVIYVGSAGNVQVITPSGDTVTFQGLLAGTVIPVQVVQIVTGGTTASTAALVAIY